MWLEGHCVLGACWQCCGWRILKRTNEPQISSSLLISNSDRVHSTSFLPLYRFRPRILVGLDPIIILFPSLSHSPRSRSLSDRENSITCASLTRSTWQLGCGVRTSLSLSRTTHVHRRSSRYSPSSTRFPTFIRLHVSFGVDGRRPEVQLQIQSCCSGNGRTERSLFT